MHMSFEDQIRERAYHIWLAGGMADGQAHEHWMSAEQAVLGELAAETAEPVVIITKAEPKAAKPRKAAAKPAISKPAAAKVVAAAKTTRTRKAQATTH